MSKFELDLEVLKSTQRNLKAGLGFLSIIMLVFMTLSTLSCYQQGTEVQLLVL